MTLDEAIKHAEEVAEQNEGLCERIHPAMQLSNYGKCAEEHRQLAEWLKDYKRLLEQEPYTEIDRQAVINYIRTEIQQKWIPVSKRLPKAGEHIGDVAKYYLVQNEYGDMLVAHYTHSKYWKQIYQLKPIGDEIVAWMPLPEPYEIENEDE